MLLKGKRERLCDFFTEVLLYVEKADYLDRVRCKMSLEISSAEFWQQNNFCTVEDLYFFHFAFAICFSQIYSISEHKILCDRYELSFLILNYYFTCNLRTWSPLVTQNRNHFPLTIFPSQRNIYSRKYTEMVAKFRIPLWKSKKIWLLFLALFLMRYFRARALENVTFSVSFLFSEC